MPGRCEAVSGCNGSASPAAGGLVAQSFAPALGEEMEGLQPSGSSQDINLLSLVPDLGSVEQAMAQVSYQPLWPLNTNGPRKAAAL